MYEIMFFGDRPAKWDCPYDFIIFCDCNPNIREDFPIGFVVILGKRTVLLLFWATLWVMPKVQKFLNSPG